jgi:hypothetical protein
VSHIADEPPRADLFARLAERDQRADADDRSEAQTARAFRARIAQDGVT